VSLVEFLNQIRNFCGPILSASASLTASTCDPAMRAASSVIVPCIAIPPVKGSYIVRFEFCDIEQNENPVLLQYNSQSYDCYYHAMTRQINRVSAEFLFHREKVAVNISFTQKKNLFFTGYAHRKLTLWKSCGLGLVLMILRTRDKIDHADYP